MAAVHTASNHWAGKALGAAAALIFAPAAPAALVWWVLAGIALGHVLDTMAAHVGSADGRAAPRYRRRLSSAGLRFTFAALGRLAAASGNPGTEHVRCAERLMSRLALSDDRRQEALVWFHAGQDDAFPFDAVAHASRAEFADHPVLRDLTVDALCRMSALADTASATAELLALGERIGVTREVLAQQAVAAAALMPLRSAIDRARDTLGVAPGDGADAIRLAYRRRVSRWHPDRLPVDADPAQRAQAERRMWQLREALETLLAADAG